jgi:hypothetical protein
MSRDSRRSRARPAGHVDRALEACSTHAVESVSLVAAKPR